MEKEKSRQGSWICQKLEKTAPREGCSVSKKQKASFKGRDGTNMNESLPSGYIEVVEEETVVVHSKFWYKRKDNLKGKTGHWSKWGGGAENLFQEQIIGHWYCQSCGEEQPEELSPLVMKYDDETNLRVCPFCFETNAAKARERAKEIENPPVGLV